MTIVGFLYKEANLAKQVLKERKSKEKCLNEIKNIKK